MNRRDFDELRELLLQNERLIWSGHPRRGIFVGVNQLLAIVIGVIAISIPVIITLLNFGLFRGPKVGGIIVLFIVWYLAYSIVIKRIFDAVHRRFTVYGLTDRRAIIITGIVNRHARSVRLNTLSTIELMERSDRLGTIRCISRADGWYRKNRRKEIKPIPLFRAIVDARHVHDLLVDRSGIQPTHRVASAAGDPGDPESHVRVYKGSLP